MRNLHQLFSKEEDISLEEKALRFALDKENDQIWTITKTLLQSYSFSRHKQEHVFPISVESNVVGLEYIPQLFSVCFAVTSGEIYSVNVESGGEVECVGAVDSGLLCMSWSPDYELVVFITGKNTVLVMTKEWDVVSECPIDTKEIVENEITSNKLSSNTVSWRGDGNYFAVNSMRDGIRNITVWERTGSLHSVGEQMKDISSIVSWRPCGDLIASSQILPNKQEIIFYERNGLRHGEFTIKDKSTILDIKWNVDSHIIAVLLNPIDNNNLFKIQLWYRSNYHWFLKQELLYETKGVQYVWDSEDATILHVLTEDGKYNEIKYDWYYDVTSNIDSSNPGLVSMIDGNNLLFSPLKYMVVPPPMSASNNILDTSILSVFYSSDYIVGVQLNNNTIEFYKSKAENNTIGSNNKIPEYPFSTPMVFVGKISSTTPKLSFNSLKQICLMEDFQLIAIQSNSYSNDNIIYIKLDSSNKETITITNIITTRTNKKILRLYGNAKVNKTHCVVEYIDGSLQSFNIECDNETERLTSFEDISSLPSPCSQISTAIVAGNKEVIIGLDSRSRLYINNKLLSSECNSFVIHDVFLIFTTITNLIRFIPLFDPNLLLPPTATTTTTTVATTTTQTSSHITYDFTMREVERGSCLVTVISNDAKVVLQLPRGNLEVIYPRILVLHQIALYLDKLDYLSAFLSCRKHRIDMNLLYDYNPSQFLANVSLFIQQINQEDYLNLFISSLSNTDVTVNLYTNINKSSSTLEANKSELTVIKTTTNNKSTVSDKVNIICDKMREELQLTKETKYLLCILTTYVKKNPPELEEVLELIRSLREKDTIIDVNATSNSTSTSATSNITGESALKYVCWLVDVDKLYDVALGMYDFDLVIMVAQKSQKDPKEYLPFLNDLQQMEKYYQRYSIDKYLGRHSKSLLNLSQAGDQYFETCRLITKEHRLYEEAIDIYTNDKDKLNVILEDYGDYLLAYSNFEEAGFMYNNGGHFEKSLHAFKSAGNWRLAVSVAFKLNYDEKEMHLLYVELIEVLSTVGKHADASMIAFDYCKDVEQGVHHLMLSNDWHEVLRRCLLNNRQDLVKDVLLPGVQESFETYRDQIKEWTETYKKSAARLEVVRATKLAFPQVGPQQGERQDDDAASMASGLSAFSGMSTNTGTTRSTASGYSNYSGTSSLSKKSKTKKQRKPKKKVKGKEGSKYEDEYLTDVLKRIIPTAKYQETVGSLIKILLYFNENAKASELQELLSTYLELVEGSWNLFTPLPLPPDPDQPVPLPPKPTIVDTSIAWKLKLFNK